MKAKGLLVLCVVGICGLVFFVPSFRTAVTQHILRFTGSSRFILGNTNTVSTQEEVSALKAQIAALVQENRYLETELGLRSVEQTRLPVRLLVERSILYRTAYLDVRGTSVAAGSYVYAQNNVVAGTIESVEAGTAKISFLGSGEKFLAEIVSTGEIIELTGNGIGYYTGTIPKSTSMSTGETIKLKGYPQSIVGTVSSIEDDSTSVSTIWVRSPINLNKTKIFYVDQN